MVLRVAPRRGLERLTERLDPRSVRGLHGLLELRSGAVVRDRLAEAGELVGLELVVAAADEEPGRGELRVQAGEAARPVGDDAIGADLVRRLVAGEPDVAVLAEHLHAAAQLVRERLEQLLERLAHRTLVRV